MSGEAPARRSVDGRIARGIRTREAILDACQELIAEAGGLPTGAQLAERAGVSPRSVFTHFGDMDGVLAAAARQTFGWVVETHVEIPLGRPIEERLEAFCVRQAETLERTAPLYRALTAARRGARRKRCSAPVRDVLAGADQLRRNYIAHVFGPDLRGVDPRPREVLVEALVAASSWNQWEGLRGEQGLSYEQALDVMRLTLRGLLCRPQPRL